MFGPKKMQKTEETMSSEGYIHKWSAGSEETQRKCAEIREKLDKSKAGQTVLSHIVSLDNLSRLGGKFESAPQQVIEFSRVLLTALRNDKRAFGLPNPFPKAVVFGNFSGAKKLVYSENINLIRLIALAGVTSQESDMRIAVGVNECIRFSEQRDCSLLMTVSLPWQSGVQWIEWEIRSIRKSGDLQLVDGEIFFSKRCDEVKEANSIMKSMRTNPKLAMMFKKQIELNIRASSVDAEGEDEVEAAEAGADDPHREVATLRSVVAELRKDREIFAEEKAELERKHKLSIRRLKEQFDEEKKELQKSEAHATAELEQEQKKSEQKLKESALETSKIFSENVRLEERVESLLDKIKLLEEAASVSFKNQNAQVKTLDHEREQAKLRAEEVVVAHERRVSDLTLRINRVSMDLQQAKVEESRQASLLETARAERDSMQCELASSMAEYRSLWFRFLCSRTAIAIGKQRIATERKNSKKKLDDLESKAKKAEKKVSLAKRATEEALNEARMSAKREAEATAVTHADTAVTKSVSVIEIQTEPMQSPPELLHLQSIIDGNYIEIEQLKEKLASSTGRGEFGGGVPHLDALIKSLADESKRLHAHVCELTQHRVVAMHQQQQHQQPYQEYYMGVSNHAYGAPPAGYYS